ncbi:MAG: phosphoglycerate mutase family protein, partial [Alistipes sp.]|nr:phosphoglycerate mutase family protein [Alistipes sp.]
RMADRIAAALTDRTRTAILRLKYLTPDDEHIMGVEYYQAVLRDGVRTWDEFVAWRAAHPVTGIVEWMP